ncbi:MAG: hypothetical protein QUS14_05135, partial [Pyrinomonadaceae bacterium]|nr:hypothetical protein [Pyrinomonadaceae bacterium]
MRTFLRFALSGSLLLALFINVIPCGPAFVTPVFEIKSSPEFPYSEFAAGRLGIIKPEFHRSVLLAAFRYLNGGGFTPDEQKALTEVWRAEFRKEAYGDDDISETIKAWVAKRSEVVGKEEKLPPIYVERDYGGFDFFPNCTRNAFETATETLADRASTHGSESEAVKEWVRGQDAVFSNCSTGKVSPGEPEMSMPQWLQKDRAYQLAAASFYSMDYEDAKRRFRDIALDFDSPWRETADYLVARTLIRQASVGNMPAKTVELYEEAEQQLRNFSSSSGKFTDSAERMLGLIKYRTRPQERVRELAQKLTLNGGSNFRQDVIDYVWLLDKFERLALEDLERQQLTEQVKTFPQGELTSEQQIAVRRLKQLNGEETDTYTPGLPQPRTPDELAFRIYSQDYSQNWTIYVPIDATEAQALELAESTIGTPLTPELKDRVLTARQSAYSSRFGGNVAEAYEGGYHGDEKFSVGLMPPFLSDDEITNWLFSYPVSYTHLRAHETA